jgi:hypothetical protein
MPGRIDTTGLLQDHRQLAKTIQRLRVGGGVDLVVDPCHADDLAAEELRFGSISHGDILKIGVVERTICRVESRLEVEGSEDECGGVLHVETEAHARRRVVVAGGVKDGKCVVGASLTDASAGDEHGPSWIDRRGGFAPADRRFVVAALDVFFEETNP